MGVDGARRDAGLVAPDVLEQILARADAAAVLDQVDEQAHLQRADVDLVAVDEHVVAVDVELERADEVAAALRRGRRGRSGAGRRARRMAPTRRTSSRTLNGLTT